MAMIFDSESRFLFHDRCLAPSIILTDDEKALCEDYDADATAEKRAEEYEAPEECDHCGAFLVEDTRAPESPLAQQLRNMAIQYRDWQVTDILCRLAAIAERHDTTTYDLYRHSARILREWEYPIPATLFREQMPAIVHAAYRAIVAIQEWAEKWDGRSILTLHKVTDEDIVKYPHLDEYSHADANGDGWDVYDMAGCLDMWCDGEATCCGCGTRIMSVCANDPYSPTLAYGPCCFTIE